MSPTGGKGRLLLSIVVAAFALLLLGSRFVGNIFPSASELAAEPLSSSGGEGEPAASPTPSPTESPDDSTATSDTTISLGEQLVIIPILPKDAIAAILELTFISVEEAEPLMSRNELVMGVSINGDHRVYSVPFLSQHEAVNDTVGGLPVLITW